MKICIPTGTDKGLSGKIYSHFGSAPYFIIYDTEERVYEVINNNDKKHKHGMCQPLDAIKGLNIDAVVCGGMGARAVTKLNEGGIKVFISETKTVKDMINKIRKLEFKELTLDKACKNHTCD